MLRPGKLWRHEGEAMGRQTDLVLDASLPKHKSQVGGKAKDPKPTSPTTNLANGSMALLDKLTLRLTLELCSRMYMLEP